MLASSGVKILSSRRQGAEKCSFHFFVGFIGCHPLCTTIYSALLQTADVQEHTTAETS